MIDYPICRDGGVRMRFRHVRWLHIWAVVTTGLLLIAVAFPQQWTGMLMSARAHFASAGRLWGTRAGVHRHAGDRVEDLSCRQHRPDAGPQTICTVVQAARRVAADRVGLDAG